MIDVVDKETRSRMMAGIRSTNTKPEIFTRKTLHRLGYRFRLGSKIGKIKPDIVLRCHNVAVFVHGCFWHQHEGCKHAYSDRKRSDFWKKKFSDNRTRDERVAKELLSEGWRVAVIWECATRKPKVFEKEIGKIDRWIKSGKSQYFESDYKKVD